MQRGTFAVDGLPRGGWHLYLVPKDDEGEEADRVWVGAKSGRPGRPEFLPLTDPLAEIIMADDPAEPATPADYKPAQVLAALANWGEVTELRAKGRLPTLLQCLYLDVQAARSRLLPTDDRAVGVLAATGGTGCEADWALAHRLCAAMNGGALVG